MHAVVASAICAVLAVTSHAQAPAADRTEPTFEVAAVRPCPDQAQPGSARGTLAVSGPRLRVSCMTVQELVARAYSSNGFIDRSHGLTVAIEGVRANYVAVPEGRDGYLGTPLLNNAGTAAGSTLNSKVRGGPAWVRRDRFWIDAVVSGSTERSVVGSSLRDLLTTRFQLRVHRELEQAPAFALVVHRNGLKVAPSTTVCDVPRVGAAGCQLRLEQNGSTLGLSGNGISIDSLAVSLSRQLAAPVLDHTNIDADARFDFSVEFAIDDSTPGSGFVPPTGRPADPSAAASIFTAVQEQLGLRLDRITAPREFLAIDHVERPTPN